jgi:hypothetical protein
MDQENEDQRALRLWITAGLSIPEVTDLKGDAGYLLNNMIAKYTLAAEHYAVSEAAKRKLRKEGVNIKKTHIRRRFYGRERPYMYEHSVPAKVIRTALLKSDRTEATVAEILKQTGKVTLLLRTENKKLKNAKLRSAMPVGWKIGDDPEARYKDVGIRISNATLKVRGAIVR